MQKNYKSVKLSTQWTSIGYYSLWVSLIIFVPIILYMSFTFNESINWLSLGFGLLLTAFIIYCLLFLSTGYIKDNVLYLKKFHKAEANYPIEQIESVKVYETRKDSYVLVTMTNDEGSEKYLLATSKVFYAGKVRNTEAVLKEIVANNKNKNNEI